MDLLKRIKAIERLIEKKMEEIKTVTEPTVIFHLSGEIDGLTLALNLLKAPDFVFMGGIK